MAGLPQPLGGVLPARPARGEAGGTRWPLLSQQSFLHEEPDSKGFRRLQALGEGAVGRVFRAVCVRDGNVYAVKDIVGTPDDVAKQTARAMDHLRLVDDKGTKHIVRYYDVYEETLPTGEARLSISMDLATEGDLKAFLQCSPGLSEPFVLKVGIQVLEALYYMGKADPPRLHMDVKPENILVFNGGEHFKVCDFDASRPLGQQGLEAGQKTTEEYRAPEVEDGEFSTACDVFSLGVLLFVVAALPEFPWVDMGDEGRLLNDPMFADQALLERVLREQLSQQTYLAPKDTGSDDGPELRMRHYTDDLVSLVAKMLHHDPAKRVTQQECYDELQRIYDGLEDGSIVPKTDDILDTDGPPAAEATPKRQAQSGQSNAATTR